jgi:hypothetical protein
MDDWGVAPALCLFSAVLRLSLRKGEGRVRVSLRWGAAPANSPPQSLSPLRKERGESTCAKRVPASLSATVNST